VSVRLLHLAQEGDTSGYFPQLARWHDRRRYRMHFATLNPMAHWLREFMEREGVACFSADAHSRAEYPAALFHLASYLGRQGIDILHTHLFEPSVIGLAAGIVADTPVRVMTRHYSDYHTRIHKSWHVRLDQLCTRWSTAVVAVSAHTAEHMTSVEKAPAQKLHVILNGIDFDRVKLSDPHAPGRLREALGAQDAYLLLVPARLHPEKGHTYLFGALPELRGRLQQPLIVLLAGVGPFEAAYREEVRARGCDDLVRFLGFRKDLPDLMAAADLVVLPSVAEAFGLVLAEALFLGTPVVATRAGGITEIVEDGVDGVLVPPADSVALAGAIASLLACPERRRALAGHAQAKVQECFSFEKMVRGYEGLYESLLAARERAA
jgi:glycosyltransferase involved in cell wall biosynthesis